MSTATAVGLAAALALAACKFEEPTRSDFQRDLPFPDGGPVLGSPGVWRATEVFIDKPDGLVGFQNVISSAVDSDHLNLLVVETAGDLDADRWAVSIGSAERVDAGTFAFDPTYPPAATTATVDGARRFTTDAPVAFVLRVSFPLEIPVPLSGARVVATASANGLRLSDGLLTGVIEGERAAATLIDLQGDGDPTNDQPLANFLGDPDVDTDGDGTVDDFSAQFAFSSEAVLLQEATP